MKIEVFIGKEVETKFYFTPPVIEIYTKEEFEEILDASACGSNGGTFSCDPCYMGTYAPIFLGSSCKS